MQEVGELARSIWLGVATFALSVAALTGNAFAQGYVPATDIATAQLMAPTAADTFYGASTTSTNDLPATPRPNEIKELARGLRNDPDAIYEYVRNAVEIEWSYGLRKGALGALLDRSGTSFDQAKLMVELLREAGYTATYKAGTIALSGAQFQSWSGILKATPACQLLSSGGTPAIINGSTSATCAYGTADISTITLSHVWVEVTIGGSNYLFDPSYKPHDFFAGINYASSMGFSAGQAQTQANSGMTTGTNSGVGFVRTLNYTALKNTVTTYGTNLLNAISAISPAADVKDIIGGRRIQRFETPVGGLRQVSLPYTAVVQRTWTGGIPNQYRTTLRVQLVKRNDTTLQTTETFIDRTLYVDEIYGRKLVVEPNYPVSDNNYLATFQVNLRLTDRSGTGTTLATFSKANDPTPLRTSTLNKVLLTINTPLAPSSTGTASLTGQYLDKTVEKYARFWTPLTILHAWGTTGLGLQEAWGTRVDTPGPEIPWQQYTECETCDSYFRENVGDARREQLAASWMVQSSRAAALHTEIAKAEFTRHYSVGVVTHDVNMRANFLPPTTSAVAIYYSMADSFDRVDVESKISLISRTDVASERRAGLFAIAATWAALEGSVSGQSADLPDISSTATRFAWGNAPPSGQDFSGGYGARRFYQFTNSTQTAQALSLSRVEGQTGATNPSYMSGSTEADGPLLTAGEVTTRRDKFSTAVSDAVAQGYQVTASEEAFLGPGQRASFRLLISAPANYQYLPSEQRGGALLAVKYSGSDPVSIAHILTSHQENSKGGGGGEQATQKGDYDPATAADVLKSRFVDKSQALGIDLKTGAVTYSAPAAIVSGNGSFPYQLTGKLIWRGGAETSTLYGPEDHTRPQSPWTSNWHNALNLSSSAMEAMGASDARAAAGTIALFKAQQDIYAAAASTERDVAGTLASAIWLEQISGNTVNVTVGADSRQFVKAVSGQWIAPGSSAYAELTQTGSRSVHVKPCNGTVTWSPTRGWNDSGLSFTVKNANGDTQAFGFWSKNYQSGASASTCAQAHGFRMSSWTFPKGVTVNLAYTSGHSGDYGQMDYLSEVSNTLGWKVRFTYTDGKLTGINNGLAGGDTRSLAIAREVLSGRVTSVTDAAGAQTRFTTSIVNGMHRLDKVFDADDGAIASLEYTYDALDRVKEAKDAVALQEGGRNAHAIYLGAGYRSQRTDPLGGTFTVFFDEDGRPSRYTDEISRATNVKYDGRGRVIEYQYPELDKDKLEYDVRGNITRMTRVAKPSLPEADIVVQAQWDATWNKPSAIVDAMGRQSDFTYKLSGPGAGEMLTAVRPAPAAGQPRPTYSFTYSTYGKIATATDPKGVVTSNVYNAGNGNLDTTTLDPTGLNLTTSFGYDALGDVTSTTDPRGNAVSTVYDVLRRPTIVKNHNGGTGAALLAAQRTTYNSVGLETGTEAGSVFSGTNISSWATLTTSVYSPTGLVRTETDASGDVVTTTYDGVDRVKSVADGENRVTDNVYDLAGQVLKVRRAVGSPLQQDYQTNTWTSNGQLASVTNAKGFATTYTYDGFDRPKRVTYPDASYTEALTYNANGSVLTNRTRGAQTLTFSYDLLNRLTRKSTPDRVETFAYDAVDLQTCSEVWASGSATTTCGTGSPIIRVQTGYDNAKRLTSEAQLVGGTTRTVGYGYDASSNRIRITWPDNWRAVYAFDPLNRMTSAGYDADGNGTTDGTLALYQYTPKSQISGVRRGVATWGSGITGTDITWEADADLDTITHTLNGETAAWDYGYDHSARLISEVRSTPYSYAPTLAQNITYSVGAAGSATQKLDQYATADGQAATYDSNGNRTTLAGLTTTHDSENRLVSASKTGMSVAYIYDTKGRRAMKDFSSGGTDIVFLSAGDMEIAEYSGATLLRRYVPGDKIDDRVAMIEATGAISYYHADRLGNVVAVTNGSGVVSDRYKYTPFGIETPLATSGNPYRYTGRRYDPETGLYHYRARYYDPTEIGGGRFLEVDPIGYKDHMNLYAYVGNDSLNKVDPTGTCSFRALGMAGGASVLDGPIPIGEAVGLAILTADCIDGILKWFTPTTIVTAPVTVTTSDNFDDRIFDHIKVKPTSKGVKVSGDVDVGSIPDELLPEAAEILDNSITTRNRENGEFPRGDPNGDPSERDRHRRYEGHKLRTELEQSKLDEVRRRIKDLQK